MPDLQGIPYSDPIRVYILVYEDSRFAIICRMATAAFDTLQAARKLQNAGFDQPKAEALAELMRQRDIDYATRADIASTRADIASTKRDIASIKADIADIRADIAGIKADIARLESAINQLRNWFVSGLVTILVAVLATAFLPR